MEERSKSFSRVFLTGISSEVYLLPRSIRNNYGNDFNRGQIPGPVTFVTHKKGSLGYAHFFLTTTTYPHLGVMEDNRPLLTGEKLMVLEFKYYLNRSFSKEYKVT